MVVDFGHHSRKVLVTPSFFPENRKTGDFERDSAFENGLETGSKKQTFGHVDWLSLSQSFPGQNLPKINDGCVMVFDSDGECEHTTLKSFQVSGSYESSVFLRCDGTTIDFTGNPSRWGRTDNVYGYTFSESLIIVNSILRSHGLPPFTSGIPYWEQGLNGSQRRKAWTGCRVRRIDLTQNYETGSPESAHAFLRWLATQKMKSLKTAHYGDYDTVDFGRGSNRKYFKVYSKGVELLKHSKSKQDVSTLEKSHRLETIDRIAEYVRACGLVRAELTLKTKALFDLNCCYLGSFDMPTIEAEFRKCSEVFERANAEMDDLEHLPRATLAVYRMWQAGDDIKTKVQKSQFYEQRKKLLPYGIDISIPSNVVQFVPRTRVITLSASTNPPDWYQLPPVRNLVAA